ncbi:MAG: rhodanese-like domain-containing protein [Nocardioides sp.]
MGEIDIVQAADAQGRGVLLVDVREPSEYAEGHVPGALNIPMEHLPSRVDELNRDAPVHVICASGNRSSAMADFLTGAGFDAANVVGGTSAWIRAGHPIKKGATR